MAMGILRRWRWEVDRPDSSNAVASSKLAELLGMAMAGWHFADGIETALNRAVSAAGEKEGAASPPPRATSEQTFFSEREHRRTADHEVIENADIDQCQCLLQGLSQGLVRVTGLGATGRVVMHKHDPRGVAHKSGLDHLPRVDRSLGQRAGEHRLEVEQAILRVQEKYAEDLPLESGELKPQPVPDRRRRVQGERPCPDPRLQDLRGALQHRALFRGEIAGVHNIAAHGATPPWPVRWIVRSCGPPMVLASAHVRLPGWRADSCALRHPSWTPDTQPIGR